MFSRSLFVALLAVAVFQITDASPIDKRQLASVPVSAGDALSGNSANVLGGLKRQLASIPVDVGDALSGNSANVLGSLKRQLADVPVTVGDVLSGGSLVVGRELPDLKRQLGADGPGSLFELFDDVSANVCGKPKRQLASVPVDVGDLLSGDSLNVLGGGLKRQLPGLPGLPVPTVPGLPIPTVPGNPLPSVPGLPTVPGLPIPTIPGLPIPL
ncbi:hypothetical protein PLICRDRAFT_697449 [Plicaturopsis crispa FD-325 SS-3]|nr:hypothetical protein PLICRDRAFT_697449 [Plicaturopsis crispa FD-325 SS-3]